MPMLRLKNASLHYELEGPECAPVVVLSSSLGTDLRMWDGQVEGLARQFRVLRYDTRGHGSSSVPAGPYSLEDLAGDVLELLDVLGIERFHFCGVSLGGMTALWLAIHARQRVLSIMPCNTAARIGSENSWNARIEQVEAHGIASIADATMQRWFTQFFRESQPAQVEATRRILASTDVKGYVACCAALRDADLTAAIRSIVAPAAVISGTHDPVTPPSDGRFLLENMSAAVYFELNAAHLSNMEQPGSFLEIMLKFAGRF